jgi:hypothetical protein
MPVLKEYETVSRITANSPGDQRWTVKGFVREGKLLLLVMLLPGTPGRMPSPPLWLLISVISVYT